MAPQDRHDDRDAARGDEDHAPHVRLERIRPILQLVQHREIPKAPQSASSALLCPLCQLTSKYSAQQ